MKMLFCSILLVLLIIASFSLTGFKKMKHVDQDAVKMLFESAKSPLPAKQEVEKISKPPASPKRENRKRATDDQQHQTRGAKRQRKGQPSTAEPEDPAVTEKEALRLQSRDLWKIRDELESKVSKEALIGLLEFNGQHVPTGLSKLLDSVSDGMLFGALAVCPSCGNGPLRYSNTGFKCSAMLTDWAPCIYFTRDPGRKPFKIPDEYHDVDLLAKYKYVKRARLFASDLAGPNGSSSVDKRPLAGVKVAIIAPDGDDENEFPSGQTVDQLSAIARQLGAVVVKGVTSALGLVVSTQDLVDSLLNKPKGSGGKKKHPLSVCMQSGIRVVDEYFLDALTNDSKAKLWELFRLYTISDWNVKDIQPPPVIKKVDRRFELDDLDEERGKFTLKGGAFIDPESGLADKASVLKDAKNGDPMTAVLGMVDLLRGSNSFYRLQALHSDTSKSKFWLYRSWGRIGTSIGGQKLEEFHSRERVVDAFHELFYEKSGNHWHNRARFVKQPNRFYLMELDMSEAQEKAKQTQQLSTIPSKLHPAVQALISFICDIESMKQTMMEFEIDLKKMPLGKLSSKQIREAYTCLNALSKLIAAAKKAKEEPNTGLLMAHSTQFYTLIPHDFGMQAPPLLSTAKAVKNKAKMLEDLLEIEIAYNIMTAGGNNGKLDEECPIDVQYRKLKTELSPMAHECDEFKRVLDYVKQTHAPTHSAYTLEVEEVFTVSRDSEEKRYSAKADLHNRRLLWHGSRRTNWAGILSQGLRIAPPEAPVTGYMFGKGIYFADMVSKAANYCMTDRRNPRGLMLLCEVALGDMEERLYASSEPLRPGKHSCKGVGSTMPDPLTYYTNPNGVIYPIGQPSKTPDMDQSGGALMYNEYIVYDVAQVKQQYLVRVKFNYD